MGISAVCEVVDHGPETEVAATVVVESEPTARDELARVMLDAHRALMDLNRSNHDQFVEVVAMLERAVDEP
jgi:hypothetical protein